MIITISGLAETTAGLSRLLDIANLVPDFEAGGDVFLNAARTYPAERPGQAYVRSGGLGDAWARATSADPTAITIDITNPTAYGSLVYGDSNGDQAFMHAGRWPTVSGLVTDSEAAVVAVIEDGIDEWLARAGVV